MKKAIVITLGIATMLSMTACKVTNSLAETLDPVAGAVEEVVATTTTAPVVTAQEAAALKIEVTDAVNNTVTAGGEKYSFKIPQIKVEGVNTDEVNKTIKADIEKAYYEGKNKNSYDSKYEFYVNNNNVSIVVSNMDLTGGEFVFVKAYNIDASTGKFVESKDIVKLSGMTDAEFFGKVKEIYKQFNDKQSAAEGVTDGDKAVFEENFEQISYKFIQPYIGANGKLCFIGDVFCAGGAGVSYETFEV